MGKFVMKTTKNGKIKFDLKASNGQIVATSQSYKAAKYARTGINSVIVSESATGSIAYSMVYVIGAEDADADAILAQIMENINPRKWVCVAAEKQAGFTMGNDVFFVMGATDMIDTIVGHAQTKAEALGFVCGAVEEQVG